LQSGIDFYPLTRRRSTSAAVSSARAEHPWLAAGSPMVQQQALRDVAQARANYVGGTHEPPSWRKAGRNEAFRVVAVTPGGVADP
jgi:putative transposase